MTLNKKSKAPNELLGFVSLIKSNIQSFSKLIISQKQTRALRQ